MAVVRRSEQEGLDLLDALKMREGMNLKEIGEVLAIKYPQRIINMLIDRVAVSEVEEYKAAKRSYVRIDSEVLEDSEVFNAELDNTKVTGSGKACLSTSR